MLLTATLNLAPTLRPRATKRRVAKRGSLQVVAHGGVGGSGGTQYPGKDKPHGSDQAPWRKKFNFDDPDQADPDANSGRSSGGWTPPPPAQESFAAAAPSSGGSSWDAPAPSSGGSSWDAPAPSSGGSSWDAPAPSSGGSSWDAPAAPAASYGGGGGHGSGGRPDRVIVREGITYDPDQYDPNP